MLRTAGVLIIASIAVAGCSSDDESASTTAASTTTVSTTAASTTAAPTTAAPTTAAPTLPTTAAPIAAAPTTAAPTTIAPTTIAPTTIAPTTVPVEPLVILVTNDDGIGAGGLAASVAALSELPDVEIVVVAPADNQSGTSDTVTDGEVTSAEGETIDGTPGIAVDGTPADSVTLAIEQLGVAPDLVVSGVNEGQNIGPFTELSGTVGAARTAARLGVPAIAASAGIPPEGVEPAWPETAAYVVQFIESVRRDDGSLDLAVTVTSFNAPTCGEAGEIRGLVSVEVASVFPEGANPLATDCTSTAEAPADDYGALSIGFATVADVGF